MRALCLLAALLPALTQATGLQLDQRDGEQRFYRGQLALSGEYSYRPHDEINSQLCFFPQGPSAAAIPRDADDARLPWFCFANQQQAFAQLGVPAELPSGKCVIAGTARILVSEYKVDARAMDASDLAQLDAVQQVGAAELQPCEE
ncbi:hypothetical protein IB232_11190 [Pseudomonas sp. PDM15]|uniref:hypothetical protein n=1 Tax=Pseudomonas sp. PDM15 TaxID=2769303 RepID=UPI001781DBF1|nr:hypothetical protein [Pseudomonas sp. PDM15]MBD9425886.1 hypothetical protein [Pseudomonas sp. PDM15]